MEAIDFLLDPLRSGIGLRALFEVALAGAFCGALGFWIVTERLTYGAESLSEKDVELTALALVGGLSELLVSWLDGRLNVDKERLIEHCVGLFVAAAEVSSE